MICPHCHATNRDGAKFCDECGTRLPAHTDAPADERASAAASPADAFACEADEDGARVPERSSDGDAASGSVGDTGADAFADEDAGAGAGSSAEDAAAASASSDALESEPDADTQDFQPASEPGEAEAENAPDAEPGLVGADASALGKDAEDPSVSEPAGEAADKTAVIADLPRIDQGDESVAGDADKTGVIGSRADAPASEASQTRRLDLSGFDEYLPQDAYVPPAPSWRDGGTMRLPRIDADSASSQAAKSFLAPDEKRRDGRKIAKVVAGIVVAIAVVAAIVVAATYQMELWGGKAVPDVVGMTQADATNTLESRGFTVRATQVKSDDTEGIVLLMDPGSGGRIPEGGEVVIHVAQSRSIPDVVGLSQDDAKSAIDDEGLDNVTYTTERSDEPEGTVLSVDPEPGSRARANTAVTVVVAEPYRVPDVNGMSASDASASIEDAGYVSSTEYVYNEQVAEGTVLGTTPGANEVLASGSTVTVQVALSRGTELISATQNLLAAGATVVIDGVSYDVASCDAVSYEGNETTSYTITASPFTYFLGVKLPLEARTVTGTITWNADNTIASGAPSISLG